MNVESLIDKIDLFNELAIESGLKRDVQDYINSLAQGQNRNITFMSGLAMNLKTYLEDVENNSVEDALHILLKESTAFTEDYEIAELEELISDPEIDANEYYTKFNEILSRINKSLKENETELDNLRETLINFVSGSEDYKSDEEQALISLIFKDHKSTKSLKEFSKVLSRWNRTLLIYHSLLKSESPNEIPLVQIQNGSIDVIFNIDVDVAIDLVEIIKIGLKVYGAYLLYKSKTAKEILETITGNKKLMELEKKREILVLENIKESMKQKAIEQHKEKLKTDKKIDKKGIVHKADVVSGVLTDHIIKGNEIKLLTAPLDSDTDETQEQQAQEQQALELRKQTAIVRERAKGIDKEVQKLLVEKYNFEDSELDK